MINLFKKIIYSSSKPSLPQNIGIEITSKCNANCVMCGRQYINKRGKAEINFEDFKKIIAQFNNIKSIQFCGYCESLLNKDIFKMIHYIRENIEVVLVTNGKLLTKENSYLLIEAGLDRINISHHGFNREEFFEMRGERDEDVYDKVNLNIKRLVETKKETKSCINISLNYVITKINYSHLTEFIVFAKELGVDAITPIQLTVIDGKTNDLYLKKELEWALKRGKEKAKSVGIRFNPISSISYGICREMWNTIQIQSNGNILPCMGYFPNEASVDNIFEKDINEIWNCNEYVKYRESVINGIHVKCNNCQLGNTPNRYNIEWLTNRYVRPFIHRGRQILQKN